MSLSDKNGFITNLVNGIYPVKVLSFVVIMNNVGLRYYTLFLFCLHFCITNSNAINISISNEYIEIQTHEWTNFTVQLRSEDTDKLNETFILEVKHDNNVAIYPKIVEINSHNFTEGTYTFFLNALSPGHINICLIIVNNDKEINENIKFYVDIVKNKSLDIAAWWGAFFYYIFGYLGIYSQILLNFARQSVFGLSADYIYFNFITNICYCVYVSFLPTIIKNNPEYYEKQYDISLFEKFHSLHLVLLAIIFVIQLFKYTCDTRTLSTVGKETLGAMALFLFCGFILSNFNTIDYFTLLYILFLISLTTDLTQCMPQIYTNYYYKNTIGWCIWSSYFSILSRLFYLVQVVVVCYNYDNYYLLLNDEKLWVIIPIITQHIILILQQNCLYYESTEINPEDGIIQNYEKRSSRNLMNYEEIPSSLIY